MRLESVLLQLQSVKNKQIKRKELAYLATFIAEDLHKLSIEQQSIHEKFQNHKVGSMLADFQGKSLTISMVDQIFRTNSSLRNFKQLRYLIKRFGVPDFLPVWEKIMVKLLSDAGLLFPTFVLKMIRTRFLKETKDLVHDVEETKFAEYQKKRFDEGINLNINFLGEEVLHEKEAEQRVKEYKRLLKDPKVVYISVKISNLYSQINLADYEYSHFKIKERLSQLYSLALHKKGVNVQGKTRPKLITLDMEAFKDLGLTVDVFKGTLDEPEFLNLEAGIVLQAYIPDSFSILQSLVRWSARRMKRGGEKIRIRLVKGANIAMEQVEAELKGWHQAPFLSKTETDANFKKMLEFACNPMVTQYINVGIATHNLFDISYALLLRSMYNLEDCVEFEMLEGMANYQGRIVNQLQGDMLMYAPLVSMQKFDNSLAYLMRRLDENTQPDHFLKEIMLSESNEYEWKRQRDKFLKSCQYMDKILHEPLRVQNRNFETCTIFPEEHFQNAVDTDWAMDENRKWIKEEAVSFLVKDSGEIPIQVGGKICNTSLKAKVFRPSERTKADYHYHMGDDNSIQEAYDTAHKYMDEWNNISYEQKKKIFAQVYKGICARRGELICALMEGVSKSVQEADMEVSEALDMISFYSKYMDEVTLSFAKSKPLGVIAIIPPWNFPLAIPIGGVVSSLIMGNTVIIKPAPEAVSICWEFCKTFWDRGVPREALQFLPLDESDYGKAFIQHPLLNGIILTGSSYTAMYFKELNPHVKLFAETSGLNMMYVSNVCDHEDAIKHIVESAFGFSGQKCSALSILLLHEELYQNKEFLENLKQATLSREVGNALDFKNKVMPLVQEPSIVLKNELEQLSNGESWLLKPVAVKAPLLWSPGIKMGITKKSALFNKECFGAIMGVMKVKSVEDAIQISNASCFGLTSGIQSLDEREVNQWISKVECGNIYVNRGMTGAIVKRQPFGGWKDSCFGSGAKAGGPNYTLQLAYWEDLMGEDQCRVINSSAGRKILDHFSLEQKEVKSLLGVYDDYCAIYNHHFAKTHDPIHLHSESNQFYYVPKKNFCFRIEKGDDMMDVIKVLMAMKISKVSGLVSMEVDMINPSFEHEIKGIQFVTQSHEQFMGVLSNYKYFRVLKEKKSWNELFSSCRGVQLLDRKPLIEGRLELLNYFHEKTVSMTLHRYGHIIK